MPAITLSVPEVIANSVSDEPGGAEISALNNGGFVAVWHDRDGRIYARTFDAGGESVGADFLVGSGARDANRPCVTVLEDGSFVIAYSAITHIANESDEIWAQRFDQNGNAIGGEVILSSHANYSTVGPELAALEGGGYVLVSNYLFRDGSYYGVYAQRFHANGTAMESDQLVNNTTERFQTIGSVTGLDGGGYAVAWRSNEVDGSLYAAMMRIFDESGAPIGPEIRINQYAHHSQDYPSITQLNDGSLVVTWQSNTQDGDERGIYARHYDASGQALWHEIRVNTQTAGDQARPDIVALEGGGYVIVWINADSDAETAEIMAQAYGEDGQPIGGNVQLSSTDRESSLSAELAALRDGGIAVIWQNRIWGSSDTDIAVTSFDVSVPTSQSNVLRGGAGADVIDGLAGNDRIFGRGGDDTLLGSAGQDRIAGGNGDDTLNGGDGADILRGGQGDDEMSGGGGNDTLSGGIGRDVLDGDDGDDTLNGNAGVDWLNGGVGNDTLNGGDSHDMLIGGTGADVLNGSGGRDTASYLTAAGGVTASLANSSGNTGDAAGDTYDSIENLRGSNARDTLIGNTRANRIEGRGGADRIEGRGGDDKLIGGGGNDIVFGGRGDDIMTGGANSDQFVFNSGQDVITDFGNGNDRLKLDDALWGNTNLSTADILGFASVVNGDTVFDFGDGNTLTLENYTDIAGLGSDLLVY